MKYNYPHMGYREIKDVFMPGEDVLAVPIIEQGQKVREIPLPPGTWRAFRKTAESLLQYSEEIFAKH